MQSACAVLYCIPWAVWLYHILPHYLIKRIIFGENVLNIKCTFLFTLQLLPETLLILRRNERIIIINLHWSSCKEPVILSHFWSNLDSPRNIFKKTPQTWTFMQIRPLWVMFFQAGGRRDTKDVADSRFSQFCETHLKLYQQHVKPRTFKYSVCFMKRVKTDWIHYRNQTGSTFCNKL
jgi:hypothetical protein